MGKAGYRNGAVGNWFSRHASEDQVKKKKTGQNLELTNVANSRKCSGNLSQPTQQLSNRSFVLFYIWMLHAHWHVV